MIDPRSGEPSQGAPSDGDDLHEDMIEEPVLIGGMPLEDFVPEGHAPHAPTESVGAPPGGKGCAAVLLLVGIAVSGMIIAITASSLRSNR
ncbi:MAG: hypothetical protein U0822_11845 [Anaerolineae bacterium]